MKTRKNSGESSYFCTSTKVKFCQTTYNEKFSKIIEEFPKIDDIHPFYADLCRIPSQEQKSLCVD